MLRNLNKKFYIIVSIVGVLFILITTLIFKTETKSSELPVYKVIALRETEPILFQGVVEAKNSEYHFFDSSMGNITTISVVNGQEVKAKDDIAVYQNNSIVDQITEQKITLEKLNLVLENAQENLTNATNKQIELENELSQVNYNLTDLENTKEEIIKKEELVTKKEQIEQNLEDQKNTIIQERQSFEAANLDVLTANQMIEELKKIETKKVKANFDGIVFVDKAGIGDASVPYATLLSKEIFVKGIVTEYDFDKLIKDAEVKVITQEITADGKITFISNLPEKDENTKNITKYKFLVQTDYPFHYGQNVQISFSTKILEIPKSAVLETTDGTFVYTYSLGSVHIRKVSLKKTAQNYIISEGLEPGTQVISKPKKDLEDGQEVVLEK